MKQKHGAGVIGNEGWASISFDGRGTEQRPEQLFSYDANGNRLSVVEGGETSSYSYPAASNRLLGKTGPNAATYTYDASGNIVGDGTAVYQYDDRGRLVDVDAGASVYGYNAAGQRVSKTAGATRLFVYGASGELVGEYAASGVPISESVWFNGVPVAVLRDNSVYLVHTDHLGTPRAVTDNGEIVWRWDSDPFGAAAAEQDPDGDSVEFEYNLRFPGHYFDQETGRHYNYFRTFDPGTGRYAESDPLGLSGGENSYLYASASPLNNVDPYGLVDWDGRVTGGTFLTAGLYFFSLESDCVKGKEATVDVTFAGVGLGFGFEKVKSSGLTGISGNIKFRDALNFVYPNVFSGDGFIASAGLALPPSHTTVAGVALAGGNVEDIASGGACGAIRLGQAGTVGCSFIVGLDLSVGALYGSSTVRNFDLRDCDECGAGD